MDGCSNLVPTTRGEDATGRRSTHALLCTHSLNLLCTPLDLGLYPPLQPRHRDMEAGLKQVSNRELCACTVNCERYFQMSPKVSPYALKNNNNITV